MEINWFEIVCSYGQFHNSMYKSKLQLIFQWKKDTLFVLLILPIITDKSLIHILSRQ